MNWGPAENGVERFGEEEEGIASWRKRVSESELSIWRKALKTIHFTRTTDLTPNMANSTLIKSIDIHYKTPRPLWVALPEPSNRAVCLQIPSGSVWKTKQGFTSTSLTSYNKQNNVFLMDGESRLPLPLPALVQSDWPVVGFPWLQLVVSRWWMGKVGGGCLLPFSFGTSHGLTGTLWRSTRADVLLRPLAQPQRAPENARFSTFTFSMFHLTRWYGDGKMHAEAYASVSPRGRSHTNSCKVCKKRHKCNMAPSYNSHYAENYTELIKCHTVVTF